MPKKSKCNKIHEENNPTLPKCKEFFLLFVILEKENELHDARLYQNRTCLLNPNHKIENSLSTGEPNSKHQKGILEGLGFKQTGGH